jgi:copper(I)-binding protein
MRIYSLVLSTALLVSASASAHDYALGTLRIAHPHARSTVPGQPSGAAYLDLENTGKTPDKLISIKSPIAKSAELHTMSMAADIMRMREVTALDIPPSAKIAMSPGTGYHIMLVGLTHQLKPGEKFPMTLSFKNAGKIKVLVAVDDDNKNQNAAKAANMVHKH